MLTIISLVLLAVLLIALMCWFAYAMGEGGIFGFIIFYEAFKALGTLLLAVLSALVDAIAGNQ